MVMMPQVGVGDFGQALDFAGMIGAKFDHREFVVSCVNRNSVSGRPTKLLKLPSVLRTLPRNDCAAQGSLRQNRRDHFFGGRFAVGTGNRKYLGRQPLAPIMRQIAQAP